MDVISDLVRARDYKNISGTQAERMIKTHDNILILDVRSPEEFMSGHIPNAINIPADDMKYNMSTLNYYRQSEIIVYCASGIRSKSASDFLVKNGFSKVYNLNGGIPYYKGKLV